MKSRGTKANPVGHGMSKDDREATEMVGTLSEEAAGFAFTETLAPEYCYINSYMDTSN